MKRPWIIHPFLFAIYPPLFIFSKNMGKVPPFHVFLAATVLALAVLVLWILCSGILKSRTRAGVIVSCLLIWLFYFYSISWVAKGLVIGGVMIGRDRYLFGFWTACFVLAVVFFMRSVRRFHDLTRIINLVSVILVVLCLVDIGAYCLRGKDLSAYSPHRAEVDESGIESKGLSTAQSGGSDRLPDIYYIILDAYARYDSLREYYGFDNREFYNYLVVKGFFIADKSRSNYDYTGLSLPSCLNMEYLQNLPDWASKNNRAMRFLKSRGYKYITIGLNDEYADLNRCYRGGNEFAKYEFTEYLLRMTYIGCTISNMGCGGSLNSGLRNSILFAFDELAQVSRIDGPKFVFAHIISPHGPYVFGPDGEKNTLWSLRLGLRQLYVRQLMYINKKAMELIDAILSQSTVPPLIVLQADHGPRIATAAVSPFNPQALNDRLAIFSAYYLPDGRKDILYDSITPVNTFRILFNHYFNADYELLPDESYQLINGRFINVTDRFTDEEGVRQGGPLG